MIDPGMILNVDIPDNLFNRETEDKNAELTYVKLSENNSRKVHRDFKIKRTKKCRYSMRGKENGI